MNCISRKGRRKNRLKKLISIAAAAALSLSLVSCADIEATVRKNNSYDISFSWWGNENRNNYMLKSVSLFDKENEDISVNAKYSEYNQYKNKIRADLDGGRGADVMIFDYSTMYEYNQKEDCFYDLEEFEDIDFSNFDENKLSYGRINGKLKGIPTSLTSLTFFYSRALYDQYGLAVPKNWNDIFEAAEIMKSDGIYPLSFNSNGFWLVCNAYNEQLTGRTLFDAEGKFIGTKEDLTIMLDFYLQLIDNKVSKRAEDFSETDMENCKTAGIAAWISDADHYCSGAQQAGLEIETGNNPTMEDYKLYGWYIKPVSLYTIKKDTKSPLASAKLVNYMLNNEDAVINQGTEQGIPISKSAVETLAARDMLTGIEYRANVKMTVNKEFLPMNGQLENQLVIEAFSKACNKVYYDQLSVEDGAFEACEEIKAIIADNT